jgi:type I restriction enzyme S subunit
MSFLDNLLDGVAVEWKPLGEFADYEQPTKYLVDSKNYNDNFLTPVLTAGKTFILGYTDETNGIYKASKMPVIIFDDFTTANKWVDFDFKAKSSAMKMITSKDKSKALLKYIYYWLNTLPSDLIDGDHKRQWISNYSKKLIPIPCPENPKKSLEIQQKIVAILDTITELTAELKAELKARKQQYNHYREQSYCFDENEVQHLPMGDESIGEFQRGKRFVKTDLITEGVPTIHYGEMYTHYGTWADETISFVSEKLVNDKNLRVAKKGDVVIVAAGETIEDIGKGTAWLGDEGVVVHDACFSYKTVLNPKFVAYFTRTKQFHDQIKRHISSGKISAINSKGLGKAIIPVPSYEVQERVVSILDKFDILTNSLSEGLPKEIELRRKQYEYYRDMLLTFPKHNLEE